MKEIDALDDVVARASSSEAGPLAVRLLAAVAALAVKMAGPRDDALLLPGEACAIERIPRRKLTSLARSAAAREWAVWTSPRTLRVREGPFRRAMAERHARLQSEKTRRARARRRRRDAGA